MKKKLIEIFKKKAVHKFVASTKPYGEAYIKSDDWDSLVDEILKLIIEDIDDTRDWDKFYCEVLNEIQNK